VKLVLADGVPQEVRLVFFVASLQAISKKDGGLKPIAVGLILRRLASKIANRWATERVLPILGPRKLVVGVRGGSGPRSAFLRCLRISISYHS